jgi:hypothetical protein
VRVTPSLLKDGHRSPATPMERLQTLFQRRPQIDLTKFFLSIATDGDDVSDGRITDHDKFKQAIREVSTFLRSITLIFLF